MLAASGPAAGAQCGRRPQRATVQISPPFSSHSATLHTLLPSRPSDLQGCTVATRVPAPGRAWSVQRRPRTACCRASTSDSSASAQFTDEYVERLRQLAVVMTPDTVQRLRGTLVGRERDELEQLCRDIEAVRSHDLLISDAPGPQQGSPAPASPEPGSAPSAQGGGAAEDRDGLLPPVPETSSPFPATFDLYLRQVVFPGVTETDYQEILDTMGRDKLTQIAELYNGVVSFASEMVPEEELPRRYEELTSRIAELISQVKEEAGEDEDDTYTEAHTAAAAAADTPLPSQPQQQRQQQQAAASTSSAAGLVGRARRQQGAAAGQSRGRARGAEATAPAPRAWGSGWGVRRRNGSTNVSDSSQPPAPPVASAFSHSVPAQPLPVPSHPHDATLVDAPSQQADVASVNAHVGPGQSVAAQQGSGDVNAGEQARQSQHSDRTLQRHGRQAEPQPAAAAATAASRASTAREWLVRRPVDVSLSSAFAWAAWPPAMPEPAAAPAGASSAADARERVPAGSGAGAQDGRAPRRRRASGSAGSANRSRDVVVTSSGSLSKVSTQTVKSSHADTAI